MDKNNAHRHLFEFVYIFKGHSEKTRKREEIVIESCGPRQFKHEYLKAILC